MTEITYRLFAAVLTVSVSTSVVVLLLTALHRPLGRMRAAARYLIWMLIIARLALPVTLPLLPNGLSIQLPRMEKTPTVVEEILPVEPDFSDLASNPGAVHAPETNALPTGGEIIPTVPDPVFFPAVTAPSNDPAVPVPTAPTTNSAPAVTPTLPAEEPVSASALPDPILLAAVLWLAVALLLLTLRLGRALALNARLNKLGTPLTDPALCRLHERLCIRMALREVPQIRVCPDLGSPLVYGFRRPVILLPDGVDTPAAFVGIVSHELTHIRRRDLWLKLLSLFALSVHWFNPVVYLAARRFHEETELSCDEAVLNGMDEDARRGYGYVLLSILRRGGRRADGLTTQFKPDKHAVRARFEGILDLSQKKRGRAWIALTLAVCLLMGTLAACRVVPALPNDTTDAADSTANPDTTAQTGEETTESAVTSLPPVETEIKPLTLPMEPASKSPAKLDPLCGADEKSYRNLGSREITVYSVDDVYRTTWKPITENIDGLAFYENDAHEQALILDPTGDEGFMIVNSIHGMYQMCQYRTLARITIGQTDAIEVEYISGSRSSIHIFTWENGKLCRWFGASNALFRTDLDGDGNTEFIADAGLMIPNHTLISLRDGSLYQINLNRFFAAQYPDATMISVSFDEPYFDVSLQFGEEEKRESYLYLNGTLIPAAKTALTPTEESAIPLVFTPFDQTEAKRTPLAVAGANYVLSENAISIRHGDGRAETYVRVSEVNEGLAIYEKDGKRYLIDEAGKENNQFYIVSPAHGYDDTTILDCIPLYTDALPGDAILVEYVYDGRVTTECYRRSGQSLYRCFIITDALLPIDLDGDGVLELLVCEKTSHVGRKMIACRSGELCHTDVADAIAPYFPAQTELHVYYTDGYLHVQNVTYSGDPVILRFRYRSGALVPVTFPTVPEEKIVLNYEPLSALTAHYQLIDTIGEKLFTLEQERYPKDLRTVCTEAIGDDYMLIEWHEDAQMGFFQTKNKDYVLIVPYHINYPRTADTPYTFGFRILERVEYPGGVTWEVLAGESVICVRSRENGKPQTHYYAWQNGTLILRMYVSDPLAAQDLDGDGSIEYVGSMTAQADIPCIFTERNGRLYVARLGGLENVYSLDYVPETASFALLTASDGGITAQTAAYRDGALIIGASAPPITSELEHDLNYTLTGDVALPTDYTSLIRLPRVNLPQAEGVNKQITADFYSLTVCANQPAAQFRQLMIPDRGRPVSRAKLEDRGFGDIIALNVNYAYAEQTDGSLTLVVDYVSLSLNGKTSKTSFTYRISGDGLLLDHTSDVIETAGTPTLNTDLYFKGICSADGQDYLLLRLTTNRLYFATYPENGRLREETGLISYYGEAFTLWQNYGTSIGMHSYSWDPVRRGYVGSEFGDFRWLDLLVQIDGEEYARLSAESEARLAREAADTSPAARIRLTTPIRNGDEDPDLLRVRIVNGSDAPISLSTAYRLERRGAGTESDFNWYPIACNGTPTFSPTRFTIAAGKEAVINYDLSVYTALLESGFYYRAIIPVRLSDGSEVSLTCTFGGNGLGLAVDNTSADWFYTAHNVAENRWANPFTLGLTYDTHFDVAYTQDNTPWEYIRISADEVKLYIPIKVINKVSDTHGEEALYRYFKETPLTLRVNRKIIPLSAPSFALSETMIIATYKTAEPITRHSGMTLTLSFGTEERVLPSDRRTIDGELEAALLAAKPEDALLTAAPIGGTPRLYLFAEGLTFRLDWEGTSRVHTLALPFGCASGRIVGAASGAGSGELIVYVKAESSQGTEYYAYLQYCGDHIDFDSVYPVSATEEIPNRIP